MRVNCTGRKLHSCRRLVCTTTCSTEASVGCLFVIVLVLRISAIGETAHAMMIGMMVQRFYFISRWENYEHSKLFVMFVRPMILVHKL